MLANRVYTMIKKGFRMNKYKLFNNKLNYAVNKKRHISSYSNNPKYDNEDDDYLLLVCGSILLCAYNTHRK